MRKPDSLFLKATYWHGEANVLNHMVETDKAFWLRAAVRDGIFTECLEKTSSGHRLLRNNFSAWLQAQIRKSECSG
jgi:hypothetical protein